MGGNKSDRSPRVAMGGIWDPSVMLSGEKRVVITGLGGVTPIGTGLDAMWQSLSHQKSGVRKLAAFDTDGAATEIAAEVLDFDPKQFVKQRKSLKVMARDIQLAVGAAELAVQDARLESAPCDPVRFGVNFGAGLIASELDELGGPVDQSTNGSRKFDLKKWGQSGMEQLFPLWMLKYLPNMPACHISIIYNAQGPNNSITVGESSATMAIGEAMRIIGRGAADVFLAGGTDSKIHPLSFVKLALTSRLSRRWNEPARAARPFDADRDGIVPGEGASVLILEELGHAKARKAAIHGELLGFGAACNPKDPWTAVEQAIQRAMTDAGIRPADLGHVVAIGAGEPEADKREAAMLARLLGDDSVPIVSYTGYLGFLDAAIGSAKLVTDLLAARRGTLPAALNFDRPDADAPPLSILREPIDYPEKPFLSYDLSHGGQCGALVVRPLEVD